MSDLVNWMKTNSVAQKMRNLIENMENGQIYEPLTDLMAKGKATVEITVDEVQAYWRRIQKRPRKRKASTEAKQAKPPEGEEPETPQPED